MWQCLHPLHSILFFVSLYTYHFHSDHVIWRRNMSHLQIEIPTSTNRGVWERIMLHTGITDCNLFSQGVFPSLPMKSPQSLVPVVTLEYLKSLQTNNWQMRWNSTHVKIWTQNLVNDEKCINTKWVRRKLMLVYPLWDNSSAVTVVVVISYILSASCLLDF